MSTSYPPIKIMRVGDFTSYEGTAVSFSARDLSGMVSAYNASARVAPIVLGHPKTNEPTFGRIGELALDEGFVTAIPAEVKPGLIDAVRAGRYKRVSASFDPPSRPSNPSPGSYFLRHVGMLGASAPAVRGLGVVSFGAAVGAAISFEDDLRLGNTPAASSTLSTIGRAQALQSAAPGLSHNAAMAVARDISSIVAGAVGASESVRLRAAVAVRTMVIQAVAAKPNYPEARRKAETEGQIAQLSGQTAQFIDHAFGPNPTAFG